MTPYNKQQIFGHFVLNTMYYTNIFFDFFFGTTMQGCRKVSDLGGPKSIKGISNFH